MYQKREANQCRFGALVISGKKHKVMKRVTETIKTQEGNESSSEVRSCVKVEVAVLGSPSLTVLMVSVDGKQH